MRGGEGRIGREEMEWRKTGRGGIKGRQGRNRGDERGEEGKGRYKREAREERRG